MFVFVSGIRYLGEIEPFLELDVARAALFHRRKDLEKDGTSGCSSGA